MGHMTLIHQALNLHLASTPKQCCIMGEVHTVMEKFDVDNNFQCFIDEAQVTKDGGARMINVERNIWLLSSSVCLP